MNLRNTYGDTALIAASKNNHENIVKMLLEKNADVNIQGKYGTAVELPPKRGYENIVKMLFDKGVDPNARNKYDIALELASK